jgi:hypothetical protein
MRIRNSFWAMLGPDINSSPDTFSQVHRAMLALMEEYCSDNAELRHKLTFATDIDALWYLRSNLMAALSVSQGETVARDSISRITLLFQGRQPGGALRNRS